MACLWPFSLIQGWSSEYNHYFLLQLLGKGKNNNLGIPLLKVVLLSVNNNKKVKINLHFLRMGKLGN